MKLLKQTAKKIQEFMNDKTDLSISDLAILEEDNNELGFVKYVEENKLKIALISLRFEIMRRYKLITEIIFCEANSDDVNAKLLLKKYKEEIKHSGFPDSTLDNLLDNYFKLLQVYAL